MPDRLTRTLDQAILELQELQELLEVLETRTQTTLRVVEATAAAEATLALPIVPIADETDGVIPVEGEELLPLTEEDRVRLKERVHSEPAPIDRFEIHMKTGQGYSWLARAIHEEMKGTEGWTQLSEASLRQRMQGQMLYRDHVYSFSHPELLDGGPLTGGLDREELRIAQAGARYWKREGRSRYLAQQTLTETRELVTPLKPGSPPPSEPRPSAPTPDRDDSEPAPDSTDSAVCFPRYQTRLSDVPVVVIQLPQGTACLQLGGSLTMSAQVPCMDLDPKSESIQLSRRSTQTELTHGWKLKYRDDGRVTLQHRRAGDWVSAAVEVYSPREIRYHMTTHAFDFTTDEWRLEGSICGSLTVTLRPPSSQRPRAAPQSSWVDQHIPPEVVGEALVTAGTTVLPAHAIENLLTGVGPCR
jgi:hypothetical protein